MTGDTDRTRRRQSQRIPIRSAVPEDEPFLRELQGLLPEPSPQLLTYGLSAGTVLVTTDTVSGTKATSQGDTTSGTKATAEGDTGAAHTTETQPATATGTPVGYLLATHGADTHLAELVVAPDARREGRGSALLAALLARRPDGERVTLAVDAENDAAQSLYRAFGFEQVGTSDTLFENGTALVFERSVV